jgi:hypothetical protein
VPSPEDIALRAVLRPRTREDGGPWTRLRCRECGVEGCLARGGDGGPVLAPPEAVGVEVPRVATFLDGAAARDLRRRAREWVEVHGPAFDLLRAAEAAGGRGEPSPDPPPRGERTGPRSRRDRGTAPPPPRSPRPPSGGLPSTPEEARAVLGVPARADRAAVDSAFRRASRRCHPDLVAHLDEDFQRLAHDKFLRLKRAHDILTR